MVAFLLLITGGINWLLYGAFNWEIGAIFGGSEAPLARLIYILFGLAAIYELITHKHSCKSCKAKEGESSQGTSSTPQQTDSAS